MSGILDGGDLDGSDPSLTWLLQAAKIGGTLEIPVTADGETYRFHIDVERAGDKPAERIDVDDYEELEAFANG